MADFIDKIKDLASRAERQFDDLKTEEATKNALVLPFISALGYDVFDPREVVPEYTADHGVKKGEKVDYAVQKDGQIVILFECKPAGSNLDDAHLSQLFRYFAVTDARVGALTNGTIYRFYSDLEESNKMDNRPFLEFNLFDFKTPTIEELNKLSKDRFDEDNVLETAGELKYVREMQRALALQLSEPTDDFVEFLTRRVFNGMLTQKRREQFTLIARRAFREFINDQITERLESAMNKYTETNEDSEEAAEPLEEGSEYSQFEIVTTEEELEGFGIVKAILREEVDPSRITYKDVKSYFGILLDGKTTQPLCRLHFNSSKRKYIGIFDQDNREEEKLYIESLDDIYKYADRIKGALKHYN